MQKKAVVILWVVCAFLVNSCAWGKNASEPNSTIPIGTISTDAAAVPPPGDVVESDIVIISVEQQYDEVNPGAESALAVHFELKKDWHFYASAKTAPSGMNLKVKPSFPGYINFSEPIFPRPQLYFDKSSGQKLEVFSGKFTVFLPFTVSRDMPKKEGTWNTLVTIKIEGAVCSDVQCRVPDFRDLGTGVSIVPDAVMAEPKFVLPKVSQMYKPVLLAKQAGYSVLFALSLAFLAGLALNIMPCVWPVLPLIVMRIVGQAKAGKRQTITMGLAFCLGILLFFASLAAANIVLRIFYGTVLQWGDQFRNPIFVAAMALLLVVLAQFMFGVFTISVPSSIAGKSSSGKGYSGAVGMGFLAAVLSTPCSFGILAAAFAWAQAQPLLSATTAIMVIGVGMAVPYAVLTSMPGLLKCLPRAGRWMELFKQAVGFALLVIAVKLITVLPEIRRAGVLYFGVILAFCVWMWGSWVGYGTKPVRKWLIRIIAAALVVLGGGLFLPAPAGELIDWQHYKSVSIETALRQERPVLIKFTADWCLSCKAVEKVVYSREDVAMLIEQKDVLAIKADTTEKDSPATLALKNIHNEPGVPVSMLFVPGSKEPLRWRGILFTDELKKSLDPLPDRKKDGKKGKNESQ